MMILKGRKTTNNKWEIIHKFDDMELYEVIQGLYNLQCDIEKDNMFRRKTRFSEYKIVLENGTEIKSSLVFVILSNMD